MGARIVVKYEDGTEEQFNPNKPRLLLAMERKFNVQVPDRHEHLFWLAHLALAPAKDFDTWVDTIDDIDTIGLEDTANGNGTQGKANDPS